MNIVYWKKIVVLALGSYIYYIINVYVPRVRANAYHMLTTPETPKCAYVIYGQPLIQPLAWIVFTSNISIVCILKKKVCSHICTTSWRTSLKPREIIWPPAFNNFTEIGTIHSQSLLYRQNKYINIFREIYFTPSLTAFQVQCSLYFDIS